MDPSQWAVVLSIGLLGGMVVCLETGYRIGRHASRKLPESAHEGIGVIEAALFALLGLLLGFSFSGATSRLDARRQLIIQEANAIGTAYLRLDELPPSEQPPLRRLFREYLDTRLRVYEKFPDLRSSDQEAEHATQIQQEIWSRAVAAAGTDPSNNAARLLLPALNEMFDVTTARSMAIHTHLPSLIFFLLVCVALVTAMLAGYAMAKRGRRSVFHMVLYATVISLTLYAVLDLDSPRSGLIRLDTADKLLLKLRDSIR